jgi:hypothetical protein
MRLSQDENEKIPALSMKNEIRLSEFFRLWYSGRLTITNRQALINRRPGPSATGETGETCMR